MPAADIVVAFVTVLTIICGVSPGLIGADEVEWDGMPWQMWKPPSEICRGIDCDGGSGVPTEVALSRDGPLYKEDL
jgi:hypothetical protein